jgi:ABC-2 type transport system permease protein
MAITTSVRSYRRLASVQFKRFLREPIALFFTVAFPVLLVLLFGFIWGNEPGSPFSPSGFGYIDTQAPAVAAIVIGTVALIGLPITTAADRRQKLLRRYQATPLRPLVYFAADVSVHFGSALLGMALVIVVARLVFGLRFGGSWVAVLGGFALSALAFVALGYVLASLVRSERVAQAVGMAIYFPLMFLSGAAIPLQTMPGTVREVARWLPLTHVVQLLQDLWFGVGWNWQSGLVLLGMLLAGAVASAALFRWE